MADEGFTSVRVVCEDGSPLSTNVYIDDKPLTDVVEVSFRVTLGEFAVTVLTLEAAKCDVTLPNAELTYREITVTQRDAVPAVEKG